MWFKWCFRGYQHLLIFYVLTGLQLQVCEPETKWTPSIPPYLPPCVFLNADWDFICSFPSMHKRLISPNVVDRTGHASAAQYRVPFARPSDDYFLHVKRYCSPLVFKVAACRFVWMKAEKCGGVGGESPTCSVMRCSCDPAVPGTSISVYERSSKAQQKDCHSEHLLGCYVTSNKAVVFRVWLLTEQCCAEDGGVMVCHTWLCDFLLLSVTDVHRCTKTQYIDADIMAFMGFFPLLALYFPLLVYILWDGFIS